MTPSDEETTKRGPGRPPGETLRRPRVIQLSDAEYAATLKSCYPEKTPDQWFEAIGL